MSNSPKEERFPRPWINGGNIIHQRQIVPRNHPSETPKPINPALPTTEMIVKRLKELDGFAPSTKEQAPTELDQTESTDQIVEGTTKRSRDDIIKALRDLENPFSKNPKL